MTSKSRIAFMVAHTELPDIECKGVGTFVLPPGMTKEEADRLLREAAQTEKENN